MIRFPRIAAGGRILGLALCLALTPPVAFAESPQFENLASGKFETIDDHLREGDWLVVMIWAHDCEICEREAGAYRQFHNRRAGNGARVLGITLDGDQYRREAREFVARHELGFDNLLAEPEMLMLYYQVLTGSGWVGTPTFLVFNPDGELRAKQVGAVEVEIVENFIASNGPVN